MAVRAGTRNIRITLAVAIAVFMGAVSPASAEQPPLAQDSATLAAVDRAMEAFRLDAHVPGMVWGIVKDGRLVHVKVAGVQDVDTKRPVTADTLFRIASMTKAFTALSILKLRDDGKVSLDAPADTYVPELRAWKYPTEDSPKIRVRELLTHTGGLVTDDPWGDRQTPLPEDDFTRLLTDGVPFTRPPATQMEYSNLGYALLGRIVANVSQGPYKDFVQRTLLTPLGMTATGYDVAAAPADRRALGYRWEDNAWKLEPTMAHGANYPVLRMRPGATGRDACRMAGAYAMGFNAATDCDLGLTLSHSGGYPGYGSHLLLLPDAGVGIFAFANRTYAGPTPPVWDAAVAMLRAGHLTARPAAVSPALTTAYAAVRTMFASGSVTAAGDVLAMNFLMDRDAQHWAADLVALKAQVGACDTAAPIAPTGALGGEFTWSCAHGRVQGELLLAPTPAPRIQSLSVMRATQ